MSVGTFCMRDHDVFLSIAHRWTTDKCRFIFPFAPSRAMTPFDNTNTFKETRTAFCVGVFEVTALSHCRLLERLSAGHDSF